MAIMQCWKCNNKAIQTGFYRYQETVTVESMKWPECHCYGEYCECEPELVLEDQTFNATTFIFMCPVCFFQFQTDSIGIGLGEIDQNLTPEQQQDKYGEFIRLEADPKINS